mgnify:FL=1
MPGGRGTGFAVMGACFVCGFDGFEESGDADEEINEARSALKERHARNGCSANIAFSD